MFGEGQKPLEQTISSGSTFSRRDRRGVGAQLGAGDLGVLTTLSEPLALVVGREHRVQE